MLKKFLKWWRGDLNRTYISLTTLILLESDTPEEYNMVGCCSTMGTDVIKLSGVYLEEALGDVEIWTNGEESFVCSSKNISFYLKGESGDELYKVPKH